MFDIYIKNYKQGNSVISTETRMLHIPFTNPDEVYINSPMVKQDTNAAGSFDFEIEPKSPFYNSFLHMRTILRVVYDGYTIFRGRVLAINNTFRGNRKIRCEDALGFLNDTQYPGIEDKNRPNETVGAYLTKLINNHNTTCGQSDKQFTLGQVPGSYTSAITADQRVENRTEKHGKTSWDSTRSGLDDLISSYGGYIRTRYENNKTYIDWIKNYFVVNNQQITLGTNLIDQTNSLEIDNVFTAVIPFGASETKNESTIVTDIVGYNTNLHSGSNYVTVSDLYNKIYTTDSARNQYLNKGYHTPADYRDAVTNYGLIFKTVSFPNADSKAVLWNYTLDWMINNYMGVINDFNIKVVDKHQIGEDGNSIQKYLVGDKVTIKYPTFNDAGDRIMASKTLTIKTITYDLFNPENTQITVGVPSDLLDHEYGVKKTKTNKTTNKKNTDDTPSPPKPNRKSPPPTAKIHIHAAIRAVLTSLHIDFTLGTYKVFSSAWSDMGNVPSYSYVISQFKYNGSTYYIGFNSGGIYYRRGDTTSSPIAYIIPSSSGKIGFSSTTGGVKYYSLNTSAGRNEFIEDEVVNDWVVVTTSDSDTEGGGSSITASSGGTKISGPGLSIKNGPLYTRKDSFALPDEATPFLTEPPDGYFGPTYDNIPPGQLPDDPSQTPKSTFSGLFGHDNKGNWMVKVNEPITYTDEAGTHKVEGAITVKDLQLPDIPSFKTEIASFNTIFAKQAYIENVIAKDIQSNTADIKSLTTRVADIEKLTVNVYMDVQGRVHFANGSTSFHDVNSTDYYQTSAKLEIHASDLIIKGPENIHAGTPTCAIDKVIQKVRIVELPNDPTYTHKIQYLSAYDSDTDANWQDGGNFSGAATLSGKWSSVNNVPTYTITADKGKIKGNAPKTTVHLTIEGTANFIYAKVYANNPSVSDNLLDQVKLDLVEYVDSHYVYLQTNGIDKGWISTKNTYDAGFDAISAPTVSFTELGEHSLGNNKGVATISNKSDGTKRSTDINLTVISDTYTDTAGNNHKCVIVSHKNAIFARVSTDFVHNAGGNTARINSITATSGQTVNKALTEYGKQYSIKLKYKNPQDNDVVVKDGTDDYECIISTPVDRYNDGWTAAYGKNVIPGASQNSAITPKWPPSTVDGAATSRTYTLTNDGNNAVKLYYTQNGNQVTAARFVHGKWSAARQGWTEGTFTSAGSNCKSGLTQLKLGSSYYYGPIKYKSGNNWIELAEDYYWYHADTYGTVKLYSKS